MRITRHIVLAVIMLACAVPAPVVLATDNAASPQVKTSQGLPDFLGKWFPALFGKKKDGPQPEETLVAPFAGADKKPEGTVTYSSADGRSYSVITGEDGKTYEVPTYGGGTRAIDGGSLAVAHRRPEQIAEWLARATSEIFTTDSATYQNHLAHLGTGMSESGMADFTKFMQDSNILAELQTQGMRLQGYVEEMPLLLNEGPLNGRYRWLYEMPVKVTFIPRGTRTYKDMKDPTENTLNFIVQTQIGRVEKGPGDDNVVIETWRVRKNNTGIAPARPR